ncbi:hypothetical protein FM106_06560 [Brachybacterium faecium]|nr:hypothetical protein FM106_06560 [Brachybacterium faecium]
MSVTVLEDSLTITHHYFKVNVYLFNNDFFLIYYLLAN